VQLALTAEIDLDEAIGGILRAEYEVQLLRGSRQILANGSV
jgi:hypothetical protein